MNHCFPLLLALLLAACSSEAPIEARVQEGPILELVDPGLPVGRVYVGDGFVGWADGGVDANLFQVVNWKERNGAPGMQLDGAQPDVLMSSTGGTSLWGVAKTATDYPQLRTSLRIDVGDGETVERTLVGGPITGWPPKGADAWRELAVLPDVGVAIEMLGVNEEGRTDVRLRATDRDPESGPLRLTIEVVGFGSKFSVTIPDALTSNGQEEAANHIPKLSMPKPGSGGVRLSILVERAGENGSVDGLKLYVSPAD